VNWVDLQKIHDAIARQASDIFLQHQCLDPQVFIMRSEPKRMVMMPPRAVRAMYETESGKNQFSSLIHSLIDPASTSARSIESQYGFLPDVVVQVHEAKHGDQAHTQDCVMIVLHAVAMGSIHVTHPIAHKPHPHVIPAVFPGPEVLDLLRGRFLVPGAKGSSSSSSVDGSVDADAALDDHEMVSRP